MRHKSEHGGVALGIETQDDLAKQAQRMLDITKTDNLRPDRVLAYLPLSADEIFALLKGLETSPLFQGYRGGPQGDLRQLANDLSALGDAFVADQTIEEIEINPLALSKSGQIIALDALSLHRD